ncbi:MAG: helix-turn-helix transcriptional regulator [Chitinophagales bacterium]|nr:helix-turn-helix transcriptional regulator [Chitinophagales bacterium]
MILPSLDEFYQELGIRIKSERLRRNIKQEDLGSYLDLSRASITNLEKGKHRPSLYQIILIANYFKMDYSDLIPVLTEKQKVKVKTRELKNIVTDQDKLDKITQSAVLDFLTAIKKD